MEKYVKKLGEKLCGKIVRNWMEKFIKFWWNNWLESFIKKNSEIDLWKNSVESFVEKLVGKSVR